MSFDHKKFGDSIKNKRIKELKVTQLQLGSELGFSGATISRLESGLLPDLLTYHTICSWLSVSMDFFFTKKKCK